MSTCGAGIENEYECKNEFGPPTVAFLPMGRAAAGFKYPGLDGGAAGRQLTTVNGSRQRHHNSNWCVTSCGRTR